MTLRAQGPGTFEHLLTAVQVDPKKLVRLSRRPATEPWWSRGVYRFDGPPAGAPGSFGTCYLAESVEVAFAESVIHESSRFLNGQFAVALSELRSRQVVRFELPAPPPPAVSAPASASLGTPAGSTGTPSAVSGGTPTRKLVLADLAGAALKKLGLNNDISAGGDYNMPMRWALAIHEADPKWDGIRYVSRQRNDETAVAVFNRSGLVMRSSKPLSQAAQDKLCDLFNVLVLP